MILFSGKPWILHKPIGKDKHQQDIPSLDRYALKKRWETILHFMVGHRSAENDGIGKDTINVLVHSGLVKTEEEGTSSDISEMPTITADGFQFLLLDTSSQVWYFILQYLDSVEKKGMNLAECLIFLFQLSYLTLGQVSNE